MNPLRALHQQPRPSHRVNPPARLLPRQPLVLERPHQQVRNPDPRRPKSQNPNPLLFKLRPRSLHRRQQRRQHHRRRSLDVVVKRAQPIPILRQQPRGIRPRKILPLQQHMRPALLHRTHKRLDEVVVLRPADALLPPTYINRIRHLLCLQREVHQ